MQSGDLQDSEEGFAGAVVVRASGLHAVFLRRSRYEIAGWKPASQC